MAATMEASQTLIQSESRVQRSYQEVQATNGQEHKVKKKKSLRRHKDEGTISVSKSSEKLHKKLKANAEPESNPHCEKCSRPVFAMERIKAEKRVWHKECFRCVQCNRQLTVETYESDHTTLYCKPHFKQLYEPKPVDDDDQTDAAPRKHQMIICESNPVELPPDVVRASDKPDLGLEELSQLDVKARFQVFESRTKEEQPLPLEPRAPRERSTALLSKLAKFKAKGMDVGVSDEYLNGVPVEASSSEPEDEEDADTVLRKSYKHTVNKEQPVSFCNMSEIVGKFETGQHDNSERHRERKQEIQNIRSRLFMGKQAKIKEMYEQSVLQSEQSKTSADKISQELELDIEKSRAIKERFENGEVFNDENQPPRNREIDDRALFNEAEKARAIKQRFESGEAFREEKQIRNRDDENALYEEGERKRAIKQRFETGEAFQDDKKVRPREEDRVLHEEGERKRAIKQRFETGEAFKDEKQVGNKETDRVLFEEGERKRAIKQRFETGEAFQDEKEKIVRNREIDDDTLFDQGIGKKSRSIFLELDANAKSQGPLSPPAQEPPKRKEIPFVPKDVVRADDRPEEVRVETADITDRFRFFETYKPEASRKEFRMTPPRQQQRPKSPSPEIYQDPSVARGADPVDVTSAAERHTASRMINVFRQMEEQVGRQEDNQGPKPLKRFTPPPPGESNHRGESSSGEEYSSEEEDSEEERRRQQHEARQRDEALRQAQALGRAKSFRGRFENWTEEPRPQAQPPAPLPEARPADRQPRIQYAEDEEDGESQLETAKSLRAKFENMQVTQTSTTKTTATTRVNRFV